MGAGVRGAPELVRARASLLLRGSSRKDRQSQGRGGESGAHNADVREERQNLKGVSRTWLCNSDAKVADENSFCTLYMNIYSCTWYIDVVYPRNPIL